jgi:hypothetical protein
LGSKVAPVIAVLNLTRKRLKFRNLATMPISRFQSLSLNVLMLALLAVLSYRQPSPVPLPGPKVSTLPENANHLPLEEQHSWNDTYGEEEQEDESKPEEKSPPKFLLNQATLLILHHRQHFFNHDHLEVITPPPRQVV